MIYKKHYVYLVECRDKTFYIGYTVDLEKRIKVHNQGNGAKYTRGRRPVKLLYYEEFQDKGHALRREMALKKLTRKQKKKLIELEWFNESSLW